MELPPKLDGEEVRKKSALEQKQRRLENEVRKAKRLVEGTLDSDNVKENKRKLREAQKKLKEFIDEYPDILRRDYKREKIYTADEPQQSKFENMALKGYSNAEKTVDKSFESGIINKKLSDRIYNIHNETDNGVFEKKDIEKNMLSSPIGRYTNQYIENEGISIEMNYDLNQSDDIDGFIIGKNISINATRHIDVNHVSETIIHETAHRQFSWNETQEDEINCRIYEYLHSHEEISNNKIQEIVDFVRQKYSEYPKGDLYGY